MRPRSLLTLLLTACVVSIAPSAHAVAMTSAFGPKQYTRHTGAPQVFHETFQHCGTQACQIVITNGNANGSDRISSASVYLNGALIAGPNAFNQQVATIVKPVSLDAVNHLTIMLASKPGSFITVEVECAASPAVLGAGFAGATLSGSTLFSAVPIMNTGTGAAQNVQLSQISVPGGTLSVPSSLPFGLGTIAAGSATVLNADFMGAFTPGTSFPLTLSGTYSAAGGTYCFSLTSELFLPPAAPGSAPLGSVSVPPHTVVGAPFPGGGPPNFPDDVNTQHWTVPIGPPNPGTPTPTATAVMPAPIGDPPPINFTVNNDLNLVSGPYNGQAANGGSVEPSGASGGGVVFVTANWTVAYSTDGGGSWKQLDPTQVFPGDAVGFCCDQIVQYVPSIDRFVWLLQGNGYRLAVARPADIINSGGSVGNFAAAWTYWNLTPNVFGPANDNKGSPISFDYPDMSVGSNYLYISWDNGCKNSCNWGHQVARTSLAGLQAGGTIEIDFTDPSDGRDSWGAHLSQDTEDEVFWVGQEGNTKIRIFSLQEGSGSYFWRDRDVFTWANNSPITTNTPDGQNWVNFLFNPTTQNPQGGFPANAVLGATRVGDNLWFAWSAGTDNHFTQPHVEMVEIDRFNDFKVLQQVQIWNNDYGFAYPALAANACSGEVGLSLEYGGNNKYYENHVVGFWGDYVVYITTDSNAGDNRFGDYVTLRQTPPTGDNPGNLFDAFGYGMNTVSGGGTASDVHYVQFGRSASTCQVIK